MATTKKIIAFVDDEPHILSALKRQLHSHVNEWNLEFFESGESALTSLRNNPADVIVSDIQMPGMSGYDLIRLVRSEFHQTVPMILSGHLDERIARNLVDSENDLLRKPCNPSELVASLRNALDRRFKRPSPQRLLSDERVAEALEILLSRGLASGIISLVDLPDYLRSHVQLPIPLDNFGVTDDKIDFSVLYDVSSDKLR